MNPHPFHRLATRALPALVVTLALLAGGCTATGSVADAPTAPSPAADAGDFRTLGASDAPLTVIEFTDLQCPYCAQFALETWPRLRAQYVDTGRVRFVSRDLPLSFHPEAVMAAVAARCAGEQGAFWEYREALFRGQAHLAKAPWAGIATRLGLDAGRFEACRNDPAATAAVREDAAIAARHGIGSTPTFVIGRFVAGQFVGEIVSGAQPFEVFAARLDALGSGESAQHQP